MNDLRQIAGPLTTMILAGAMLIFGQIYLDRKFDAEFHRPAIAIASLQ